MEELENQETVEAQEEFVDSNELDQSTLNALKGNFEIESESITNESNQSQNNNNSQTQQNKEEKANNNTTQNSNEFFNVLKTRLSNNDNKYELPKELIDGKKEDGTILSTDEKFDLFAQEVFKNTDFGPHKDIVLDLLEKSKGDGFKLEDWAKSKIEDISYLKMPSKDLIKSYYSNQTDSENKRKYTDDDIDKYMNGKSNIDIDREAEQIRKEKLNEIESRENNKQQLSKIEYDKKVQEFNSKNQKIMEDLFTEMQSNKDIGGIPHSEADIKEFKPIFEDYFKLDPQTGKQKIWDVLTSDNKTLYNLTYALHKLNSGGLKNFLTDAKNAPKKDVLNKTGIKPNLSTTSYVANQEKEYSSRDFV